MLSVPIAAGEPKRAEQDTVRGVSLDAIRKFQSEQSHIGDSLQHKLMMSAIFRSAPQLNVDPCHNCTTSVPQLYDGTTTTAR